MDAALCAEISKSRDEVKRCVECGAVFTPKSNRAKYCPDCEVRMRQEAFPVGKSGATNTAPESKCGSLRATTHRRAIRTYSHSPSVKSVAGNGYGRVRTTRG